MRIGGVVPIDLCAIIQILTNRGNQMAKRIRTPEQIEADKARMAAMRAKRGQNQNPKTQPVIERTETISVEDYKDLLKEIQELKSMQWRGEPQNERVALQGGKLIGTVEKYNLTPNHYPSPIERLAKEPRLTRFAFDANYDLKFDVGVSEYPTIDGIRTKEPKFTLELIGRVFDEETGDLTNGRYIICRLIMHEDPEAALVIAREQDLEVDEENEEAFLNEMRYIRMRDWLIKCFYPEVSKQDNRKKEMVVGGKIVEFFEVTAEESEPIKPRFGELKQHML